MSTCDHGYPAGTACPYCAALAASRATTASLHREMVEALRRVQAALDKIASQDIDWSKGTHDNVNLLQAMAEEALHGVVAALEGWEKRPRLADDPELFRLVDNQLGETEPLLDLLDTLLFGERG